MIQQKVEPEYNPRRLLRMIMMDMEDEAYGDVTTWMCSQCDLCYPACPQQIHISQLIQIVKQMAVEAGYSSPLETVTVEENLCSGCGICVMACPYEAPSLFEKCLDGHMDRFAIVDANRCMGCGICVAACPTGAIARKGVGNEEVNKRIRPLRSKNGKPSLAIFICDWCLRADSDLSILENYPESVHIIHIPCTGRNDPQLALMALGRGYDGVLVCGCKPGECHYRRGTLISACKMNIMSTMFGQMDLNRSAVRFVQIGTQERGRIRHEIETMLQDIVPSLENS